MAARIYADVAGNKCSCGGKFSKRIPHPDEESILFPKCDSCNSYPPVFLIDADAINENGVKARVKIRSTQNGEKLHKPSKVIVTIEKILEEIKAGTFELRKYDSRINREKSIFSNYAKEYLKFHKLRLDNKDITPKGYKDKERIVTKELIPFFGHLDIGSITKVTIKHFKESYLGKDKDRTRDLSLGELKTMLIRACDLDMIVKVPKFDPIKRATTRNQVISLELAIKTVELMHKQMYRDMYAIILIYALRPCEVRALKWKNIDFEKDEFTIDHHFSNEVLIPGRKSITEGEMASITYPFTEEVKEIFKKYRLEMAITPIEWREKFIFTNRFGTHISDETLRDSWVNARKKAGHNFQAYECRHASGGEIYKRSGGDLIATSRALGHTTIQMTERHYLRPDVNKKKLFGVRNLSEGVS